MQPYISVLYSHLSSVVHPVQDAALCPPLSSIQCCPSIQCRMQPYISVLHSHLSSVVHPVQDAALHQCPLLSSIQCCPSSAGCSPTSVSSTLIYPVLSIHPVQDAALHQCPPLSSIQCCLSIQCRMQPYISVLYSHLSSVVYPSSAGCSPTSVSSTLIYPVLSIHPVQDAALHQCPPLSSIQCCPSIQCRMQPYISVLHSHLSSVVHPSSAGCSPTSVSSTLIYPVLSIHPVQDAALHQCPPLSSIQCCPAPGSSPLLCHVILSPSACLSSASVPSCGLPLCNAWSIRFCCLSFSLYVLLNFVCLFV